MVRVGARLMQQMAAWTPSLGKFGAAGALTFTFVAEWRDVLQFLPYYNGKYPKDDK